MLINIDCTYMIKNGFIVLLNAILCVLICVSCSNDDEKNTSNNFATGIVELPALRNGANDVFITHSTTFNGRKVTSFSMEYDKSKKHARWVAFRFDNQTMQKNVDRKKGDDPFEPDPSLPKEYQRVRADFGAQGYDRGHICASEDRVFSREGNDLTFYYTNMSPQMHNFNTGLWVNLEGSIQRWGRSCTASDTLYVVKGGTIDKKDQIIRNINNDTSKPVPKYYYVALLFKKGESFKAIAFWMEHTASPKSIKLADYVLSIDELEEKTGIDFFPSVNDKLENALEATYSTKAWPGLE